MRVTTRTDSVSMNATFNGAALGVDHLEGFSVCISAAETSASLVGTLKLQASNNAFDETRSDGTVASGAVWVDITGATENVSGTGTFMFNVSEVYYRAVRVVWTRTSGEGTMTARWFGKGVQS